MSEQIFDIFTIDTLPGHSGIEGEVQVQDGQPFKIRFRAARKRRWLRKWEYSDWSGWFTYENEPIDLVWAAFWEEL